MSNMQVLLQCIDCDNALPTMEGTTVVCPTCGRSYRGLLGILDLRQFAPPYLSIDQDWAHAEELARCFDEMDFVSLLRHKYSLYLHYETALRDRDIDDRVSRYELSRERMRILLDVVQVSGLDPLEAKTALDIGCGTGAFAAVLAGMVQHVVAIDISMEELVLARKRLNELNMTDVLLVASCAEKLPFADHTFDLTHAMDVIEHVREPVKVVSEAARITHCNGLFYFNSPNRFNLLRPEPHVKIRFVGFLPRALQEPYVRLLSGRDYKGKHLLSLAELHTVLERALNNLPQMDFQIVHWFLLNPDAKGRKLVGKLIRAIPGLTDRINRLWGHLVNQHEVIVYNSHSSKEPRPKDRVLAAEYGNRSLDE